MLLATLLDWKHLSMTLRKLKIVGSTKNVEKKVKSLLAPKRLGDKFQFDWQWHLWWRIDTNESYFVVIYFLRPAVTETDILDK